MSEQNSSKPPRTAHPFAHATLYISLRSPFARRVRIALLENQIPFLEKVEDVFHPTGELLENNPLGRVPVIRLSSGQTICESHQILNAFYALSQPAGIQPDDILREARWSGLFVGLCDKIVERFLESLRPQHTQNLEIFEEFDALFNACLKTAEAQLQHHAWLSEKNDPQQCDFDFGIALTYASLRVGTEWRQHYPRCASRADQLENRTSFRKTLPPLPA